MWLVSILLGLMKESDSKCSKEIVFTWNWRKKQQQVKTQCVRKNGIWVWKKQRKQQYMKAWAWWHEFSWMKSKLQRKLYKIILRFVVHEKALSKTIWIPFSNMQGSGHVNPSPFHVSPVTIFHLSCYNYGEWNQTLMIPHISIPRDMNGI